MEFEMLVDPRETRAYDFWIREDIIDPISLVRAAVADVRAGVPAPTISARFHNGVASMVLRVCRLSRERFGLNEIALSGGVWQNMTLLARTIEFLRTDGFTVYIHHQVPANDGGLALGQAIIAACARSKQ